MNISWIKNLFHNQDEITNIDNKFHFEKLTPKDDIDINDYEKVFNFIFENSDIKNVAISGAYGAGKSSLLATYKKKYCKLKFIHISLAHFKPFDKEKNNDEVDDNKFANQNEDRVKESILEGKILNQLIHQIPSDKIPQTNFRIKNETNKFSIFLYTLFFIVFMLAIIHFFCFNNFRDYIYSLNIKWLTYYLYFFINKYSLIFDFLYVIIYSFIVLYCMIKIQLNKNIFHKLNIQGNEIEIFEDSDDSYFDKYLNEILYLFENSDADVIVFEDMDRFNSYKIFERLHEVNTLVNKQLNNENNNIFYKFFNWILKSNKRILRFFYLIRDDIFISKDRTKFFDYIIPVIPVIDTSNSYDQIILLFNDKLLEQKGENHNKKFDESFLQGLSLYIDDMRILKNIYNEFIIYYSKLKNIELDYNKMVAIITYKNIFPRDFYELQINQGFVYTVFANKNNLIEDEIKNIKRVIEEKNQKINMAKNEHLKSLNELNYLFIHTRAPYQNLNSLKEKDKIEYDERKQAIENRINNNITNLENDKILLEKKTISLCNKKLSEILSRDNIDSYFIDISNKNDLGEERNFNEIKRSEYFDLLKYLIRNGYIDETYADYMTYFYENSLSIKDKIFLRSILDKKAKVYDYPLDNPQKIVSRLRLVDFEQVETLNFNLFDFILTTDIYHEFAKRLINQLKDTKNYKFLREYFDLKNEVTPQVIKYFNIVWTEFFNSAVKEKFLTEKQICDYSIKSIYSSNDDVLKSINIDNCLRDYISNSKDYLEIDNPDIEKLIYSFELIEVKFFRFDYEKSNKSLLQAVYEKSLYRINAENLKFFMKHILKIENDEDIIHKNYSILSLYPKSKISQYVHQNINDYFDVVIEMSNQNINDDENIVVDILNSSELSTDNKKSYISALNTKVTSIEEITDKNLWKTLLDNNVVDYSEQNIIDCFKSMKLSENLIKFINSNSKKLDFSKIEISQEDRISFFNEILVCNSLITEKYIQIIESLNFAFNEFNTINIKKDKFEILIDMHIIEMNETNLKFIRNSYSDEKYYFIRKDIEKYVEIINANLFSKAELLEILTWNDIEDELKIRLLELYHQPISIKEKDYTLGICLHILEHNLDESDLNYLFSTFDKWDDKIQEKILCYAIQYIDNIISNSESVSELLIDKLFNADDLSREHKINLYISILPNLNESKHKDILTWLKLPKLIKIFENLRSCSGIENNKENIKILNAFIQNGIITGYEEIPDKNEFFKVKRK